MRLSSFRFRRIRPVAARNPYPIMETGVVVDMDKTTQLSSAVGLYQGSPLVLHLPAVRYLSEWSNCRALYFS